MPRTTFRLALLLSLLPLVLLLFDCTTTQHQNVAALTLCAGGIAADVVDAVANTPSVHIVSVSGSV